MQRILETAALLILVSVVALRPLVSESFESAPSAMSQALGDLADPSPLRTLLFDSAILSAACLWLLSRTIGPTTRYRWTGLEWGGLLISVAAIASCVTAGNKRLAVNGAIDWLCNVVLAIVLVQLLRTQRLRRVLLSAILASACVQAVQCWDQSIWGHDQTWEHYQSIKEDFWKRQGVALDSTKVALFEHRMLAREAQGFLPHANVAASYLSLCGLAAMGLAVAALKKKGKARGGLEGHADATKRSDLGERSERPEGERSLPGASSPWMASPPSTSARRAGEPFVPFGASNWIPVCMAFAATFILAAVVTTKSLGALLSVVAVMIVGVMCWILRVRIAAAPKRLVVFLWSMVALLAIGTLAYGLTYDRLPGWSLTFRWQYWTASAKMFADHWLTGVGRENFGRHYLQYKSIQSPEEIANPHNLLVQAACDWGAFGAIGIIAMFVGWSWVLANRKPDASPRLEPPLSSTTASHGVLWTAALLAVVTLGRAPLLGTNDLNFVYYQSVVTGAVFLAAFRLFLTASPSGNAAVVGAVAGIAAFLLHEAINFAAFVPAAATTLFASMSWTVASRHPDAPESPNPAPQTSPLTPHTSYLGWIPLMIGAMCLGIVLLTAVLPVARCQGWMERARNELNQPLCGPIADHPAWRSLQAAAAADLWDPTPHRAQAEWAATLADTSFTEQGITLRRTALDAIDAATSRDLRNIHLWRMRSDVASAIARETKADADFVHANFGAQTVLQWYPTSPADHVRLGELRLEAAEFLTRPEYREMFRRDAVNNLERALELDDQRLPWEEFHRFTETEKDAIRRKIEKARP